MSHIAAIVLIVTLGCQSWQPQPLPSPGTQTDLGHVLVGTTNGTVVDMRNAFMAHDTLSGDTYDQREIATVRVAIPSSSITSIQQSTVNVGATVAGSALMAAAITAFALIAHNGFHHP